MSNTSLRALLVLHAILAMEGICLLTSSIRHMEYWWSAVDNVTTCTFLKFKLLDTRNLNQSAVENTFSAIRLHSGSNNNPCNALKTVFINGLAYRNLYGTNWGDCGVSSGGATLISKPFSASSTSALTSHNSESNDIVPDIVHIGREAQRGLPLWLHVIRKCFQWQMSLVWNSIFGSMIFQTKFYKKLLITCRVINVIPLHICIER